VSTSNIGGEVISRASAGLVVRLWGPHALGVQYALSTRDAHQSGLPDRHQRIDTISLTYNFLGRTRFGAVEWRGTRAGGIDPVAAPPPPAPDSGAYSTERTSPPSTSIVVPVM